MTRKPSSTRARPRRAMLALALGVALALAAPMGASAAKTSAGPGAVGIGDEYFPDAGNGGYDVQHYGLNVDYRPATGVLTGTAVITATATQALTSFTLDLDGMKVQTVTVNGVAASWKRTGGELRITPKKSLRAGATMLATVRYSGVPQPTEQRLGAPGFLPTADGALVPSGPFVASTWFPVNDHPADKAMYSIRMTVPKGVEAISNGRLLWQRDTGDSSVWMWNTDRPMASDLVTAASGQYDVSSYDAGGIRYQDAVDSEVAAQGLKARTGTAFAYSGQADYSYKRLARTLTVTADDPRLSFWVDRDIEESYDFAFVEVMAEDGVWRTLPDVGGILRQSAGLAGCDDLLTMHPFLERYVDDEEWYAPCDPVGFWSADGTSDGWEEWSFDLSAYAGQDVYVSISYVSDSMVQQGGVAIDDIRAPGGVGSTSFEDDGDVMDGWTIPGAPEGEFGNENDWTVGADGPPTSAGRYAASLARQPEMVAFLAESFGPYPFRELGAIVDDAEGLPIVSAGQTRPLYSVAAFPDQDTGDAFLVHEIARQWFGASVTPARWRDAWLSDGFATYAEWMWAGREGNGTPQDYVDYYLAISPDDFWQVVVADPGPKALDAEAVSVRGAMTLHALRAAVGDDVFFDILRTWHEQHRGGNATTEEFIALAEQRSGQDLTAFFDGWLYSAERPDDGSQNNRRSIVPTSPPRVLLTER